MRPHAPLLKSKRSGASRVRLLIRDGLGWLRGFPLDERGRGRIRWQVIPRPGEDRAHEMATIDAAALRLAAQTRNRLTRRVGWALAEVFGDRDRWLASLDARLEAIKDAVHRGRPLPSGRDLARRSGAKPGALRRLAALDAARPALAPLLEAQAWLRCDRPSELAPALRFIDREADALERLLAGPDGLAAALTIVDLSVADGARRVAPLLAGLADPGAEGVRLAPPLAPASQALGRSLSKRRRPLAWPQPPPAGELTAALRALAARTARAEPGVRRRTLRLVALAFPRALVHRWGAWWARLEEHTRRAERLLVGERHGLPAPPELHKLRAKLERLERDAPPSIVGESLLAAIEAEARHPDDARFRALTSSLSALPELEADVAVRARLLLHWRWVDLRVEGRRTLKRRLITLVRTALRGRRTAFPTLHAWDSATSMPGSWTSPDVQVLRGERDPKHLGAWTQAMRALTGGASAERLGRRLADPTLWRLLAELLEASAGARLAVSSLEQLVAQKALDAADGLRRPTLEAAVRMATGDGERLTAIVTALAARERTDAGAKALARFARESGVARTAGALIAHGHVARVEEIAARWALVPAKTGAPRPPLLTGIPLAAAARALAPPWLAGYPEAFRDGLAQLAAVAPDAERAARRVLGRDVPDPGHLAREIEALRARTAEAPAGRARSSMETRLRNLERRLDRGPTISPERQQRLGRKLAHRVRLSVLRAWEAAVAPLLPRALRRLLGAAPPPAWTNDPRLPELLSAVSALAAPYRRLAARLLRARAGPRPWDLRDDPAHRAFLQRMRELDADLDLELWLDGPEPVTLSRPYGAVTLALEGDPVEVMRMGAPFGTCLSPGDFNFFSAVVNAAELNKRVLFARLADGAIAGRCLLALTDDGTLLTFHPYHHDTAPDFPEMARVFAEALALHTGAKLAVRGHVSRLLAPDWYDDGPEDLTGRFACLEEGSELRRDLVRMKPEALAERLRRELGREGVDAQTLPLVLALPELEERPELARGLVDEVTGTAKLPASAQLRAARLLRRAGCEADAMTQLMRLTAGRRWRGLEGWERPRLVAELLELGAAGEALRLLRATRPRGVRRWADEPGARALLAARAHDALCRPRRALTLYQRALAEGYLGDKGAARRARRRVRALEAQLGA